MKTPLYVPAHLRYALLGLCSLLLAAHANAQIGTRFPSERKVIADPITGTPLTFLTSTPAGDSKIYQTHPQWTADGQWLIFRSSRVPREAMAVHETTGDLVQVTEGGYMGNLNIAQKSMHLYFVRDPNWTPEQGRGQATGDLDLMRVHLEPLFTDSAAGKLKGASAYEEVVGKIPHEMGAGGSLAIDANEDVAYFRVGRDYAANYLPEGVEPYENFGPRNMGAGPTGIAKMDLKTGELGYVVSVPFQAGHLQANPWVPGEIMFCWETGGNAPQRVWMVNADGTGLRPVYREHEHDWVTHEAIITSDEVAIAIMGHREVGGEDAEWSSWGIAGSREWATGLGIVNLRTNEMRIEGQTKSGSGLWHVHGSPDGRFAVGDDFARGIYLLDRNNSEIKLLSAGHKATAADHPHPSFSRCGTKIQIQSAMLSEDNRSMNIVVIPVPQDWLDRTYPVYELESGTHR